MKNPFTIVLVLIAVVIHAELVRGDDVVALRRRVLPPYEADVYGPLPFSEEVTGFLDHELKYILGRQNENGSWDSAQPKGNGKTVMQAGGTVGNVTLTSMCGYSLRKFIEHDPKVIEDAVTRALQFVTYMINAGKLRNNVMDGPWHEVLSKVVSTARSGGVLFDPVDELHAGNHIRHQF